MGKYTENTMFLAAICYVEISLICKDLDKT